MSALTGCINGLQVEYRLIDSLIPHPTNPNTHSEAQIGLIAKSMKTFSWTNPILVDQNGMIIAGHGRWAAAKKLGYTEVPTICLRHMTAAQKRAYIIADNRLAEIAGTLDKKLLASEHEAIRLLDPEFDLTNTGFDDEDILIMLDNAAGTSEDEAPDVDRTKPPVARLGDLWKLGEHLLLCGDAVESRSYTALLAGEKATTAIVDSPYNLRIPGHVSGQAGSRDFVMASGEMTSDEFRVFLTAAFSHLIAHTVDGSIHYLFMDWRHLDEMLAATSQYTEFKNLVVWNKQSAGLGSFYRSKHELIFVMKNGKARHINNFKLGEKGRHRTNVWDYDGLAGWTPDRESELAVHPTPKPVALLADALKDCSRKGDLVLDCFAGSGTILVAAEQTGRRARAIDLDPAYVDVSIHRWQSYTGKKAILVESDRSFDEVKKERQS